jgi:hypothetical protein
MVIRMFDGCPVVQRLIARNPCRTATAWLNEDVALSARKRRPSTMLLFPEAFGPTSAVRGSRATKPFGPMLR